MAISISAHLCLYVCMLCLSLVYQSVTSLIIYFSRLDNLLVISLEIIVFHIPALQSVQSDRGGQELKVLSETDEEK